MQGGVSTNLNIIDWMTIHNLINNIFISNDKLEFIQSDSKFIRLHFESDCKIWQTLNVFLNTNTIFGSDLKNVQVKKSIYLTFITYYSFLKFVQLKNFNFNKCLIRKVF